MGSGFSGYTHPGNGRPLVDDRQCWPEPVKGKGPEGCSDAIWGGAAALAHPFPLRKPNLHGTRLSAITRLST